MSQKVPVISSGRSAMTYRAEIRLLRVGSLPYADAVAAQEIRKLAQPNLNWSHLIQLAIAHGVLPLLYKNLVLAAPTGIDVPLQTIKHQCRQNVIRNLKLAQTIQDVLKLLKENDIPAIPFKGPILAALAYGDISLRQFSDLDVLIDQQDFLRARSVLLSNQYSRIESVFGTGESEVQDLKQMKVLGECSFRHEDGLTLVDLHCRLLTGEFPISTVSLDTFRQNLATVDLLSQPVETFCPENLLLYLCIHGTKDFWKKLVWLCDIAALIESHPRLDWDRVVEQSQRLGCEQMLGLGLSLVKDILEVDLPAAIVPTLQTTFKKQSLSTQIQQRLLSGDFPQNSQHFYLERFYFYGQMQPSRMAELRYYLRYAPRFAMAGISSRLPSSRLPRGGQSKERA